jgi:hypothetical protein
MIEQQSQFLNISPPLFTGLTYYTPMWIKTFVPQRNQPLYQKIKSEKGMDSNNNYHKWHKKPANNYHICTICKVVRFAALLVQQRSCLLMGAGVKQEGVKKCTALIYEECWLEQIPTTGGILRVASNKIKSSYDVNKRQRGQEKSLNGGGKTS